jgi:hypothetical protein
MVEPPKALPSDVAFGTPHASCLQSFEELIDLKSNVFLIPTGAGIPQDTGKLGFELARLYLAWTA